MTNYLIMSGGYPEHYFYRPYEGICMRTKKPGGSFGEHISIAQNAKDGFAVYSDKSGCIHIIYIDNENRLVYSVLKNGVRKKFVLSKLSSDIFVSDMRLYSVKNRLNLLYSALYGGETLLVHCILGDHAKPCTIGSMETSHFFVYSEKVYYTDTDGNFGYVELSDEKPAGFHKLYSDAHCGSLVSCGESTMTIFTRESKLYLNGRDILYDSRMEMPVCVMCDGRHYIMWKSGNFIRYTQSFNGGATWSEPMRFMNTGNSTSLFLIQKSNDFISAYGYSTDKDVILFGKPDIFLSTSFTAPQKNELEKLRTMLDLTQREVIAAKKEISELNDTIKRLKT